MKVKGFQDTIDWYTKNAKVYADAGYAKPPYDLIDKFSRLLPHTPTILDVGCGAGRDTGLLAKKRAIATGLDLSKGLLKEAKKRNPELTFIYGNFLDLPFEDNSFDGIWAHAALVHLETIPEVRKSFREFHRVLKDKGILHIYVKLQRGKEKTKIVKDTLSNHERFFRYYTEEEIREYLDELHFTIIDFSIRKDGHDRAEVTWICIFAKK